MRALYSASLLFVLAVGLSSTARTAREPRFSNEPSQAFDGNHQDKRCGDRTHITFPDGETPPPEARGVIDNAGRAKSIAYAYFSSIFGKRMVRLPLSAKLVNGVWYVQGAEPPTLGGNLYIELCQSNGSVVNYYGTQ